MNTKQGILFIGIALLIFCAFTSIVSAKTWYVDDDGGPEIDFTNIQDAVDNASAGDTIFVYNGTYYENILLKDGVRVQGEGADVTAIDGRDSGSVVSANGVGTDTVLDGFTVTNGDTDDSGGGMYLEDSSPTISNNIFEGNAAEHNGGGISMWNSSPIIISNTIRDNSAVCGGGISIDLYSSPQITNNLIIGNSAPNGGAIFGEGYVSPKIINNNICGNSADGVHSGDGVSVFTITNNIIWGNGDDLWYCIATYSDIEDGDLGEGNICADPMFVDVAGSDYHLRASSPCIDTGNNTGAPSTDFDGNLRPIDGGGDGIAIVDMGAFEYMPIVSCDANGVQKNEFCPGEIVYVRGGGLLPNTEYKIWIQDDPINEDDILNASEDPSGSQENVTTDATGIFGPILIWSIPPEEPVTYYEYDIVVDKLGEPNTGKYNSDSDGIDSARIVGFVAPIPELPTIALFSVGLLVLARYVVLRRKNR